MANATSANGNPVMIMLLSTAASGLTFETPPRRMTMMNDTTITVKYANVCAQTNHSILNGPDVTPPHRSTEQMMIITSLSATERRLSRKRSVSYTHLTLPTIY